MTKKDTEQFKKIPKNLIDIPEWLPRKPENDKEDIDAMKGLGENIKNTGMLNPITIKEKKNGRFDLIAGSRRLKASDANELWAKIEDKMNNEKVNEFDSRVKCASENQQRLGLPFLERDKFYYETYQLGLEKKKVTSVREFADMLGMNHVTLNKYINAGEERIVKKNDIIIVSSTTEALNSTQVLNKMPEVRNILLEMNINEVLLSKDLPIISKNIDNCIQKGMSEKMVVQIIDMTRETHNVGDDSNTKTITYNVDKNKLKDLTAALIDCQPDVRNYVVDKKISTEMAMEISKFPEDVRKSVANAQISVKEAEEISIFETVEQREQLIQERMKINKWTERAGNVLENEWNKNISTRQQQVVDIKTNGDTTLKTDFDIKHQRKLDIEADRAMYFDENTRKRYRKIYTDLVTAIAVQHPRKITKSEIKKDTTRLIIEINKLSRLLLIDLGAIKNMNNDGLDFIDIEYSTKEDSSSKSDK